MAGFLVFYVKVAYKPQRTLDQVTFPKDVEKAIDPSMTITRYNRTWRFSQPRRIDGNFLVGKLGFTGLGAAIEVDYDEVLKDFIEKPISAKEVHYAHWVIDLSSQVMAFQTKPPDIRTQSFFGAFKDLLARHAELALTIEYITESHTFYEWAEGVMITKFRAILRSPNPDFAGRPRAIRLLLEETTGDRASVEVSKELSQDTQSGLRIRDTVLDEMIKYGEEGYSLFSASGSRRGQETVFDSKRKSASRRARVSEIAKEHDIWQALIDFLKRFPHRS